ILSTAPPLGAWAGRRWSVFVARGTRGAMIRLVSSPEAAATPDGVGPSAGEPTDPLRALAAQAVSGNAQAQRTLMITLGPPLLRVVRGVLGASSPDVEDVLQEVMLT